MNKKISSIPAISIIVLCALLAGTVLVLACLQVKDGLSLYSSKEPQLEDETADWKTYRNDEYGFEVKYLKDWYVWEKENPLAAGTEQGPEYIIHFTNYPYEGGYYPEDFQGISIEIEDFLKESVKDIYLPILEELKKGGAGVEEINIDTEKGYKKTVEYFQNDVIEFYILKNNNLYYFHTHNFSEEVFNQMLSTFRFIEKEKQEEIEEIIKNDPCKDQKEEDKDLCYLNAAKENRDSAICDKIQNQESKEACYEWVEFLFTYDETEEKHIEYEIEPISNWKTFVSLDLGLKIEYPSDFTAKEEINELKFLFPEINFSDTSLLLDRSGIFISKTDRRYGCSSFQEFEDWSYEKIATLNGDFFYKENWVGAGCGSGYCEFETIYHTLHNEYCYTIRLLFAYTTGLYPYDSSSWGRISFEGEKLKETFNQMFSTFKFID